MPLGHTNQYKWQSFQVHWCNDRHTKADMVLVSSKISCICVTLWKLQLIMKGKKSYKCNTCQKKNVCIGSYFKVFLTSLCFSLDSGNFSKGQVWIFIWVGFGLGGFLLFRWGFFVLLRNGFFGWIFLFWFLFI